MTDPALCAKAGDLIMVERHRVGEGGRTGEILEVFGTADHLHYRVRWEDGHETLFYPGSDALVVHADHELEEPALTHEP